MDKHVTIVAALNIAFGALCVVVALIVFVAVVGGGRLSGDEEAIWITGVVGFAIAVPMFVLGALPIVGGIGLLQWQPWARILVLILSVGSLILIPLGTIYGIYAIWVLMQDDTVRLLETTADAQSTPGGVKS